MDTHVLVTALWDAASSAEAKSPDTAAGLRAESLDLLRRLHGQLGGSADDVTVRMLAVAAVWGGELDVAAAAFGELVRRFPEHPGTGWARVWLAAVELMVGNRDAATTAAAAMQGTGGELAPELAALAAYVSAWAQFRARDYGGVVAAMERAVRGWAGGDRELVMWELVLMLARTGAGVDAAARSLAAAAEGDSPGEWYARMARGYELAGHYQLASDMLDRIASSAVPEQLVGVRYDQADHQFRLGQPDRAATAALAAHEALAACGDACPAERRDAVVDRIAKLARFFHSVYHASLDPRYFEPTRRLYQHLLRLPGRADRAELQRGLRNLQDAQRSEDGSGRHSEQMMASVAMARGEVIKACYESVLVAEPDVVGGVALTLEIDETGHVTGGTTEPGPGLEGLPAVAGCILERARTWAYPSRRAPGKTVVTYRFALAPDA